jgi:hypothetical protein
MSYKHDPMQYAYLQMTTNHHEYKYGYIHICKYISHCSAINQTLVPFPTIVVLLSICLNQHRCIHSYCVPWYKSHKKWLSHVKANSKKTHIFVARTFLMHTNQVWCTKMSFTNAIYGAVILMYRHFTVKAMVII